MSKTNYSLKSQAGYLLAGRVTAFIIRFIVPIILVRIFVKEDYGLYQQIILISLFFIPILQFGMSSSLFYFYPTAKEKAVQLMSQTFYFLVFVGIIFLPLFYLFRYHIAHFFNNDAFIKAIFPCGFYIFFFMSSFILEYIFILEKRSKLVFSYIVISQIVRTACILLFLILFRTVIAVIWSLVLFSAIRTFILYVYLKLNYKISIRILEKNYFFSQFKYSFPLGMGKIVGDLGKKVDKFVLSAFLSSSNFAIYSVASFKIPFLELLYTSFGNVMLPKISEFSKERNNEEAKKLWHKMIVSYSIITIPSVVFFTVMAYPIITFIYTEQYAASANIYRIFILIVLAQMLSYGTILKAYKETKFIFKSNLVSMLVGIILSYIFIKNFGLIGGAVSAVITFYTNSFMQLYKSKLVLNLKFSECLPWRNIGKIALYCLISSPVLFFIKGLIWSKPISIIINGLVYFSIILLLLNKTNFIHINFLKKKIIYPI